MRHQMTLIAACAGGHSTTTPSTPSPHRLLMLKQAGADEGRSSLQEENGPAPDPSPQFSLLIEVKYYFIHAISVHSSAETSRDSLCHLHTNILINGSDVSTACSWGGGGRGGGGGCRRVCGGGGVLSRGPVRLYTIKLRCSWC